MTWNPLSAEHRKKLLANGHKVALDAKDLEESDPFPVVKIIIPGTQMAWLLAELDPDEPDRAFGLCDLGKGFPEMGYVLFSEILAVSYAYGLEPIVDESFNPDKPLSKYAEEAQRKGSIL